MIKAKQIKHKLAVVFTDLKFWLVLYKVAFSTFLKWKIVKRKQYNTYTCIQVTLVTTVLRSINDIHVRKHSNVFPLVG